MPQSKISENADPLQGKVQSMFDFFLSRFINFLKVWGPLSPKPLVGDNTGDYLMTQGAHAPKALHEFVGSHYPKDCRVAKHCLS